MEQKKNEMIAEMVKKLRQMDSNSLVIMKALDEERVHNSQSGRD